jgi:PAS domain S-box-containing protein
MADEPVRPGGGGAAAQRELFESERRFRLLVEGVTDYAIYLLDPSGIITNWNMGAQRIKGYGAGEIVGRHFSGFYTPEDQEAGLPELSLETARREGRFAGEGWRVRKDGSRFRASAVIDAIYEEGRLIGFATITRDVTERQSARDALADSERNFQILVNGVTDYALFMLDPEGRVASWNAGAERIKGYTEREILGHHFSRFYTDGDRAAGRPARALQTARDTGRYEEEGLRVRKDGTIFWASVVIDAIRDQGGRLIGFAKITRDVTERHEAHAALEKVRIQLAEAQKMEALGQLTGGVAHDFNNLLMVLTGNIHTLKRAAEENPKAVRAAVAIEIAAQRGAALTRQLLTFARRQRVNPTGVNPRDMIEALREVLTSALGASIGLVVDIAPDTWPITIDVGEFEMALVNLVLNARDAMPEVGTVTIRTRNAPCDEDDELGECVTISVEDSGTGIPSDVISRIFDPFFTTKPVGKGTGLGLSQVHGFVHQAGGTVKVSSTLGEGATLTMLLPRARDGAVSVHAADGAAQEEHSGTVMLVEDNPDVAGAATSLLEQLGYAVRWVQNAEIALNEIEDNGVDVVFSDIVMPGKMSGIDLARLLRRRRPKLPILLTTGYSGAAQTLTDFTVLRKPYQLHELGRAIAEVRGEAAKVTAEAV